MNALDRTVAKPSVPAAPRGLIRFDALPDSRADGTEILAWAHALMVPGTKVLLIDADNNNDGWVPLEEAVRSRRSFAIQVRPDVLAIDLDKPELLPKLLDLAAAMSRDGLHPVVLRSGRPGHAHCWAQIPEPVLLADYKRRAKALGFDVREGSRLCRPPMSPHRNGRPLSVLGSQPSWQEALAEIGREQRRQDLEARLRRITRDPTWCLPGRTPAAVVAPRKPAGTRRRPLDREWDRIIRHGVPDGRRHQTILGAALAAVNHQWTEDEFFLVLLNGKLGEKVCEQGDEAAQRRYVSAAWQKAVARVAACPPVPGGQRVQAEVAGLREEVAAWPWKPRSGTTDRLILEGHLDIVARTGKLEHDASDRDLADAKGLARSTVSEAHQRLVTSGWLIRVTPAERRGFSTSTCWKVQCPGSKDCAISRAHISITGGAETCGRLIAHDAFRRHGLGKDTFRVWSHLDVLEPVKVTVLAKALNRTRGTVYYHLEKLSEDGLAAQSQSGWLRAGAAALDAVAEARGVAGVGADQKEKHRLERKTRKEKREKMVAPLEQVRTKEVAMTKPVVDAVVQRLAPAGQLPDRMPPWLRLIGSSASDGTSVGDQS